MWSLGCVLFEMAALKPPFEAKNMDMLFKKITKGQHQKMPSQYSLELQQLIKSLLTVSAHARPSAGKAAYLFYSK